MIRQINLIIVFSILTILSGCAGMGSYKEASEDESHSIILFKPVDNVLSLLGGLTVFPLEINGAPPSQWNKWDHKEFRIQTGETLVFVKAVVSSNLEAYGYVKFNAEEGQTYEVSRNIMKRDVEIIVKNVSGNIVARTISKKQPKINKSTYVPVYIPSS